MHLLIELTPGTFTSYKWQDSSTTSTFTISSANPSINTYWVRVTSNTCIGTDVVTININDCDIDLEIPNVFTPNGDGINDVFTPGKRKGILKMNTSIFNRWGKLIYETNDLQIAWEGKDFADGVYYWLINYTDITGKASSINGSTTIIR